MKLHYGGCACAGCLSAPRDGREDGAPPALPGGENATKPVYTQEGIISALTTMGGRYGSVAWNSGAISYSIGTGNLSSGHAEWDREYNGYAAMTSTMERTAARAFELWDDVIAISLVERSNDPSANITFNYSSATNNATYAKYSYYNTSGRADYTMADSDVWLATGWSTHNEDRDLFQGGYGVLTYVHEIGHALGLSHPGYYNGSANFASDATHFQDTRAYTVMSYFNAHENGSETDHVVDAGRRYAATPLLNDILVAQSIYGADMTTRKGNTTYGFGSNAGRDAFDFVRNSDPVVAIWDAGGTDILDVSGWNTDQRVDLTEGAFSSVGRLTHNLAIAHGAVIENATAGGGDDVLLGNGAANVLRGNGGSDRLVGYGGVDVLRGGEGADAHDGGAGFDWVLFVDGGGSVSVDLGRGRGTGGEADGDTYYRIENVAGTRNADVLIGNAADNRLDGRGGDDWLLGADGRDTLYAGDGNDSLEGGSGDDRLFGDAGNDVLEGGSGRDYLHGGAGNDWASYSGAGAAVAVSLTGGGTRGDALGDRLYSIGNLRGSAYDDTLIGNGSANLVQGGAGDDVIDSQGGDDRLDGGSGNDMLAGGNGNDTLEGGRGTDRLDGGAGADLFVFAAGDGRDRIDGFELAHDKICFVSGAGGFDQLGVVASSAGTTIKFGGSDSVLLADIGVGDITEDLFIFG